MPVEADGSLNFFWIDAYEDINKPGRIYLFGKIRSGEAQGKPAYTSCCLQVRRGSLRPIHGSPERLGVPPSGCVCFLRL